MATATTLEFEKPIVELEKQIDELKKLAGEQQLSVDEEIAPLEQKLADLRDEIYRNLTPLQRVQVARNNKRPFTLDYIRLAFTDFIELHGDRAFREDAAIVGGWARLDGETVMVIGHQRGRDTKENLQAQLRHAASGGLPEGAAPDEARREVPRAGAHVHRHAGRVGRASAPRSAASREAIARNLFEMSQLRGADRRDGHRRGRLGRRARARRRRSRAHARERGLLGDHRRGLRGDPLEGRQESGDAGAGGAARCASPRPISSSCG